MNIIDVDCCEEFVRIEVRQGYDFEVDILYEEENGQPVDLSESTFETNIMQLEFTYPNVLRLHDTKENVDAMLIKTYPLEIKQTDVLGVSRPFIIGELVIKRNYIS